MADEPTTTSTETATEQPVTEAPKVSKTFTQADVDAIVNKAKVQTRKEFSDYLELKTKAEELDKLQESSKSNEDKLRTNYDKAVRERDAALTRAQETLVRASIVSAASRLGAIDPEAVAALLPRDELVIEKDEVLGVEDAVKTLLAKKPYLRGRGAEKAGSEISGGGQEQVIFTRSQIKRWANGADGGLTPERQKQLNEAAAAGRIRQG